MTTTPTTECRGCHAPILFATTARGKHMPLNVATEKRVVLQPEFIPVPGTDDLYRRGEERAMVVDTFTPHHATCPNAADFRKERPRAVSS